jgi:hypothetical protein
LQRPKKKTQAERSYVTRHQHPHTPPTSCMKALAREYSYLPGALVESLGIADERSTIINFLVLRA